MSEHPILFSGPMVKAILEGRKTQTRRVIKPQPPGWLSKQLDSGFRKMEFLGKGLWGAMAGVANATACRAEETIRCPYGIPGDRLWVRESWRAAQTFDNMAPSVIPESRRNRDYYWHEQSLVWTKAFCDAQNKVSKMKLRARCERGPHNSPGAVIAGKLRPSIYMPRWACRLILEVKSIRVERVQEISEEDAIAEGCIYRHDYQFQKATENFRAIWDSINANRGYGWEKNPWVWVVEFKVQA